MPVGIGYIMCLARGWLCEIKQ